MVKIKGYRIDVVFPSLGFVGAGVIAWLTGWQGFLLGGLPILLLAFGLGYFRSVLLDFDNSLDK